MQKIGVITRLTKKDKGWVAQVLVDTRTQDNCLVVMPYGVDAQPTLQSFCLLIKTCNGTLAMPLNLSIQALANIDGEVYFGELDKKNYLQFQNNKTNLEVQTVKILKKYSTQQQQTIQALTQLKSAIDALAGNSVVPPPSPSPQPLLVQSALQSVSTQLTTIINQFTTEKNDIDKVLL